MQEVTQFVIPRHPLAIFSVPCVDHDDTQLFPFSFSSYVELTLTSLAGSFKTVITGPYTEVFCLSVTALPQLVLVNTSRLLFIYTVTSI